MTQATLSLDFSSNLEKTALHVLRQDPPWRALRAFRNGSGEALIHLHNVSGGILGGDELHLEARLHPHAQAQITSIGATRIYRSRAETPAACQSTRFYIGNNALLEYLPDTIIPFANSRFSQKSEIYLAEGAGLIWWETLSAGRIASGESFRFDHVSIDTAIHVEGRPVALERYALHPKLSDLSSPARFGKYLYSTTMYLCCAGKTLVEWITLEEELNMLAGSLSEGSMKWGASTLVSDGLVIRGMAQSASEITQVLHVLWQAAKQRVWGRPALRPRKIY